MGSLDNLTDNNTVDEWLDGTKADLTEAFQRLDTATVSAAEWVGTYTPTYVSTSSFTLSGDHTTTLHAGRKLKLTLTGSTVYSYVSGSPSFDSETGLTTVTIEDSSLDSSLSTMQYGIIANSNDSLPKDAVQLTDNQTLTNKTLTSPVLNTSVSGTAILDEDDMASDSNTKLATQQSIKAYIAAQLAALSTFRPGTLEGCAITYKDADEVSISAGHIEVNGTLVSVSAQDFDIGTPSVSTFGFIGINNAGTISYDETAPSYNADNKGWYNAGGTIRFPVELGWIIYADGSGNIKPFDVSGKTYSFRDALEFFDTAGAASSLSSLAVDVPGLSIPIEAEIHCYTAGGATVNIALHVLGGDAVDGAGDGNRYGVNQGNESSSAFGGSVNVLVNASGNIKYQNNIGNLNMDLINFTLPHGEL